MKNHYHSPSPPGGPAWDITFTRIARAVQPQIQASAGRLAQLFRKLGCASDLQIRQTPRGQSVFLSLIGWLGLTGIVDFTLVDGMAVGTGPCALLDARLLDACGDVVAVGLASGVRLQMTHDNTMAPTCVLDGLGQLETAVYVAALAQFNLLRSPVRNV
jgi:hypothetical protein